MGTMPVGMGNPHGGVSNVDVLSARAVERWYQCGVGLRIFTSMLSSISGKTKTEANDVWRRALLSKGDMRTSCEYPLRLQVAVAVLTVDGKRYPLDTRLVSRLGRNLRLPPFFTQ